MKKLLFSIGTIALFIFSAPAAILSTNVSAGGTHLLSTNRASIYQVELTSANACVVSFYDCDSLADPYFGTNYTSGAFPYRIAYATNIVSSYVGSNGYTNYYTNIGLFSLTKTNAAATNALPILGAFVVAGGTYAVYNVDQLHARGVTFTSSTNVSVVVNYRTGQ